MTIVEFKNLSNNMQQIIAEGLIESNRLKPDSKALIKFILDNTLYCAIENDRLLACSGFKNLRGKIRLSIIKNYNQSDEFINRVKAFTIKEKGWTYRNDSCPKEILDKINNLIDKKIGKYKLFSLIEKSNSRMIRSAESRGFNKIIDIISFDTKRTLTIMYKE